ncbi:MAG: DUF5806 family protein, partial [Methanocorpusculum sp.]|nr:DUF5806 family protein [Methanocorpusculum sp.]
MDTFEKTPGDETPKQEFENPAAEKIDEIQNDTIDWIDTAPAETQKAETELNTESINEKEGKFYYEEDRSDEINKYTKFKKVDGAAYRKVNIFLRKRTYITAREWAIARLCSDFKTPYGAEMTFIGNHLPELCPFMEETYSPQAVNQARTAFKRKVRKSGATFFYGAMCGFFTMDELDDILFESSEIAKFLLEIEGTSLEIDDEIDIEDKISEIMRKLGESANIMLNNRRGNSEEDDDEDVDEVEVEDSSKSNLEEDK